MIRQLTTRAVIVIFVAAALAQAALGRQPAKGAFSRSATNIWAEELPRFEIKSPDGKKSVVVNRKTGPDGYELGAVATVIVNGKNFDTDLGLRTNAEIAWSPDSEAFFVTYSDAGNIGRYHVEIFYVHADGLRSIEPVEDGSALFPAACMYPEFPNVAAITWIKDSSRLAVAIEVPPHSSCANMGTFRAFEISLPDGKVLRRYGQLEAKRRFARSIGVELQGADDSCVSRTRNCNPFGYTPSRPAQKDPP